MTAPLALVRPAALLVMLLHGFAACQKQKTPERRFYDEHIQPIFTGFCVGNTSPCHRVDTETQVALGNLDLSSFEAVQKRRDVLRNYGAYPQPLLLLKAVPEESVLIPYDGKLYASEIRHVGGKTLSPSSEAFFELKRWIDQGATRDGLGITPVPRLGAGPCASTRPEAVIPPAVDRASPAYQRFASEIGPMLRQSCAYSNCHNSTQADFFLACGESEAEIDANFARAASFVALLPARADQSELLLRPLSPRAGGLSHTGGTFFGDREDERWKTLRTFAEAVQANPPPAAERSPGEVFFGQQVMPILLRRGCALETCHSPNGFNDFRLRPGSVGFLSPLSLRRNYETALLEFMALDTPDVRQSRLVKKNLFPASGGITHRGGPLLEGPGPDSRTTCPTPFDAASTSAFCTLKEWHRVERQGRSLLVSPLAPGSTVPVAFVARPPDPDGPLDFDTFRGGADLRLADAQLGADGRIEQLTNSRSALTACAGLPGRNDLDVRGPEWSLDGQRLAFAVRQGASGGLDLWLLEPSANRCRPLTQDNGRMSGPVRVHSFDPVFAPDGSLVFASTVRGALTLKRLLPNADLYRVGPDLDFSRVETMTVLSGSEIGPAFMQNGQLSFTTEKATPDFYQLSGRRINWDLTDYHPLLAQRSQSSDTFGNMAPSVGYQQATEIREALDRNFVLVLSDTSAQGGGGALAVFNRSIGPFEEGRNDTTFLRSLHLADRAATGRPGTVGVYRSPFPLPDGAILASYAAAVRDPATEVPRYDLVAVDGTTGARRDLLSGGNLSLVEAAVGYRRSTRLLFRNVPQLVFGGRSTGGDMATVHFPDLPTLATLLDANLRRGRNLTAFDAARFLAVYSVSPPSSVTPDPALLAGTERVFTQRQLLGAVPLESDGSVKVSLPAGQPLIFELQGSDRKPIFTMREEHQLGPGETISPGVSRGLFNGVCAGCHGSLSGKEPDVAVTPDALTGASRSLSRDLPPRTLE